MVVLGRYWFWIGSSPGGMAWVWKLPFLFDVVGSFKSFYFPRYHTFFPDQGTSGINDQVRKPATLGIKRLEAGSDAGVIICLVFRFNRLINTQG